ncbi:hypothetical protein HD554DRAFT_1070876 [Boletus coccyginus]|nr:hypothetical protein HD554DRAFT_1070876 [Boletus coccyginus]
MAFTGSRRLRARLSTYFFNGHKTSIRLIHSPSNLPHPPAIVSLAPEHEKEACTWLSSFRAAATVPKHLAELSFSRSSGPGGQNVNKLSTKVTARCRVDAPWIPLWVRDRLMRSSYYVKSTHSILMTSSTSRSQAANVDDVLAKLHTLVAESAASLIVKSPTREQRKRVASFQKMDDVRRRLQKDKRSVAKRSRSNKDWD